MKRLILMRHAKSDWSGGPSNDHDRPLNARGRKAAVALGVWLRDNGLVPDLVLCSSAMCTRETFVRLDLPDTVETRFDRRLYLASEDIILRNLGAAKGDSILMLGHNPGIGAAAEAVLGTPPNHPQFLQYPTGATLVADFDITDWGKARWGQANARHFVVPREL